MKHFVDPNDRPTETPADNVLDDPFLSEEDLPDDSFEHPMSPDSEPESHKVSLPHVQSAPEADPNTQLASLINNQTVFNAEKLLDTRTLDDGSIQYLVKWNNYPFNEVTWEPASNILDPRLLEDFLSQTTAST